MKKLQKKLMIIDGNALIHRSFHALPPTMKTKEGEITNAVFGFTTVLLKSIKDLKPDYIVLTLDKKSPTFRHKKYKEYKANRAKAPDELYAQIPRVKDVARAFNIPIFEKDGFEADDLIGTISKKVDNKIETIIVTGDMDTLQLIDDDTKVYTMSRGLSDSVIYDKEKVRERYGLSVDQMIDYKALRGDPSDNIPGVCGIGEKGATNLLTEFKTLDGIYKNIESDKIKDRIKGLLKEHKDDAYLSQDLATIKCDVPIDFDLEKTITHDFDREKVVKLFSELEFKSLLGRVQRLDSDTTKKEDVSAEALEKADKFKRDKKAFKYHLIDDDKKFESFLIKLKKQKEFTFDTETSGFNPLLSILLGISFSWKEGEAYYLSIRSSKKGSNENLFNYQAKKAEKTHPWLLKLKSIFEDDEIKKFAHNIKFDMRVMQAQGMDIKGIEFDTMIASYLLNPGSRQHNLDSVTFTELGWEKINKDDLLGTGRDKITFSQVPDEKIYLYSCEDADFTNRLVDKLKKQLKEKQSLKLFEEIEMPLVPVLASMENKGIILNKKILDKLGKKVDKKIEELQKKIWKLAGVEFNISSPKQMKEILFEKLEISTIGIGKTKTGFSTAASELEKLKYEHEIIPLILKFRELAKLSSTYIHALPELINKNTKRIHTSFNQTITATGRLSSTEPNLQNIPVRTDLGAEIRKAFVADKGYKIVSLDYSQIELRLAAHMSEDKKMIKAFKEGFDIHTRTAAEINNIKMEEVTKQMRREAKAINFGILYGQGPFGLSQTADIPFNQAKEFIAKYFEAFPDVKKFVDSQIAMARKKEYAETIFGRRRYLPEINSSVMMVKKGAERIAINMPLQGTNADMIKIAMIKIDKLLENYKDDARMLVQVHDELLFEIKESKVDVIAKEIQKIMQDVIKLKVPVVVDIQAGDNWGELQSIK